MKNELICILRIVCLTCMIVIAFSGCKKNEKAISEWMSNYYKTPVPEQVSEKILLFDDIQIIDKYPSASQPFQGFLTQFLIDNPKEIKTIEKLIPELEPSTKEAIIRSIWLTGLSQTSTILDSIDFKFKNTQPPDLNDFSTIQSYDTLYAGYLDFQWGRFFESGKRKPIEMIVRSLEYGKFLGSMDKYKKTGTDTDRENGIKEAAFESAVWSLKSNITRHPIIRDYLVEINADPLVDPKCREFIGLILNDNKVNTAVQKDSSFYFSEIKYFSDFCNTFRPDFKNMENYAEWVDRMKADVRSLERDKPHQPWMKLALGELYRLGWNLSIDGYSTKAMTNLTDTNSTDNLFKCRQKMALGKFFLNIDIRFNSDGIRILQDVKNDCIDSLPTVVWWISYGYLAKGNRSIAISYLNEYLSLVPNDSTAFHNLQMLQKEDVKIKHIKQ